MSYTYKEITEIISKQKPFLESKYGLEKIGIYNFPEKDSGAVAIDFIVSFKKPIGMLFIDFAEYIESLLNIDAEIITDEGLKNIKDAPLRDGIKNNVKYV